MKKLTLTINPFEEVSAILCTFLGSFTSLKLLNNVKICEKNQDHYFWIVFSSFSLVILLYFPLFFLQMNAFIDKNSNFYIKLDIVLYSFFGGILITAIGLFFGFYPFYKLRKKYIIFNTKKDILFPDYINEKFFFQKTYIFYIVFAGILLGISFEAQKIITIFLGIKILGEIKIDWRLEAIFFGCAVFYGFLTILKYYCLRNKFLKEIFIVFLGILSVLLSFFSLKNLEFYTYNNKNNYIINYNRWIIKYKEVAEYIVIIVFTLSYIFKEISYYWQKKNLVYLKNIRFLLNKSSEAKNYIEKIMTANREKSKNVKAEKETVHEIKNKHIVIEQNKDLSLLMPSDEFKTKTQENSYLYDNFVLHTIHQN